MKKKLIMLAVLVLMLGVLSGCCLKHEWAPATCETPATCTKCEKTDGEPLGHDWQAATCIDPELCADCGKEQGKPLGHTWEEATCEDPEVCSACGETQGDPVGHFIAVGQILGSGTDYDHEGECENCGDHVSVPVTDWESLNERMLLGDWHGTSMTDFNRTVDIDRDAFFISFEADGSATCKMSSTFTGTWEYNRFSDDDDGSVFIYTDVDFGPGNEIFVFFMGENMDMLCVSIGDYVFFCSK